MLINTEEDSVISSVNCRIANDPKHLVGESQQHKRYFLQIYVNHILKYFFVADTYKKLCEIKLLHRVIF